MMTNPFGRLVAAVFCALCATFAAREADADKPASPAANSGSEAPLSPAQKGMHDAWAAAIKAMQRGPQSIALKDEAKLALPQGYGFVPKQEAATLMEAMGNSNDDRFLGLIVPLSNEEDWMVSVDYEPAGYIKDDDAKHWKSDELLQKLKDGTEAGNEHREKLGIPPLEVTRWVEPPAYEEATHRLVWSAEAREKGNTAERDPTVNYNTYLLGREGYISLDLITSSAAVESQKPVAKKLLAAVEFNDGKRYTDFNASTDKIAAYGLAALIGGVAVKKLGLLAVIGVFFVKFAKIIVVALAAGGGFFAKLFKRKKA
jgi:uncharacterized membrane-anchored protein